MKDIKKAVVGIVLLVLIVFTVLFLANAYNKGTFGHKAEKVADTFTEDIIGTWTGKYSISRISFEKEGRTSLTMLGVTLNGTYSDRYDLEKETHTLTIKYDTILGVSVERSYKAKLDGDRLSLTDTQLESVVMIYTKTENTAEGTSETADVQEETTAYFPGTDVYQQAILGSWKSEKSGVAGYEFKNDGAVTVSLAGFSTEGSYSLSEDTATGKCVLKINYVSMMKVSVSNEYIITIADGIMSMNQRGLESVGVTYVKQ